MRLEQLTYVIEVADNNSINIAANKLFLTPQNISKAIKQLEEELNVQIFTRSKYGMFLTADGQLIYNTAQDILKRVQFLHNTFLPAQHIPAEDICGPLSITAAADMSMVLNQLMRKITKQHASINFLYSEKESAVIYEQLLNSGYYDNCDLLFISCGKNRIDKFEELRERFEIYILKDEYMCVLMSNKSPYAKQQSISLKTLASLPIAAFTSSSLFTDELKQSFSLELLQEYGISLNIVFTTDSFYNFDRYVADGVAYGIVGSDYMSNTAKLTHKQNETITVPLKEKIVTTHLLLVNKQRDSGAQREYFVSVVREHYASTWQRF